MKIKSLFKVLALLFVCNTASAKSYTGFDFSFTDINGKEFNLDKFRGKKVLLVVNVASNCGLTPQYAGLEELYKKYKSKGLVVIGVPSNDFGGQEPGTNKEVKKFAEANYKITFPMMAKVDVVGDKAHPFYKWAEDQAGIFGTPRWNFHKYIVGKNGQIVEWFSSATEPLDERVVSVIEDNLE